MEKLGLTHTHSLGREIRLANGGYGQQVAELGSGGEECLFWRRSGGAVESGYSWGTQDT